jgi:hypothetical protein
MALDDAVDFDNILCVFTSARMQRGYLHWKVVNLAPDVLTESAMTLAVI